MVVPKIRQMYEFSVQALGHFEENATVLQNRTGELQVLLQTCTITGDNACCLVFHEKPMSSISMYLG